MKQAMVATVLLLAIGGCKGNDKGSEPPPATGEASAPPPATEDAMPAAPPSAPRQQLTAIAPIELPPPRSAHEFDFLGWSKDGLSFALQRRYLRDLDDDETNADQVWLELREVYDALTGALLHRFQVRRHQGDWGELAGGRALWESARPAAEWPALRDSLALVESQPSLEPAGWKVSAKQVATARATSLRLETRDRGVYYKGNFIAARSDPAIEIRGVRGSDEVTLLRHHWRITGEDSDAHGPVRGNLRPYWSPAGDRAVWALFRNSLMETAASTTQRATFVLGALGPQIIVADHGAGLETARQAAVTLGQASLPVASVAPRRPDSKPLNASRVLYASAAAKATATKVAAALSPPPAVAAMPADHAARDRADLVVELAGTAPAPAKPPDRSRYQLLSISIPNSWKQTGRLCRVYVSMKMMTETGDDVDDDELDPKRLRACSDRLLTMKPKERALIASCADACGDGESIPSCFDDYGKPDFPPCEPVVDDDVDGEDDE